MIPWWKIAIHRLNVIPFEAAMAWISFFAGFVGVTHLTTSTDSLNVFLPSWFVLALNISYMLSGVGILIGLGTARRDAEGAGIVLLLGSVVVRALAIAFIAGIHISTFLLLVFYTVFALACLSRIRALFSGSVTVKILQGADVLGDRLLDESELKVAQNSDDKEDA